VSVYIFGVTYTTVHDHYFPSRTDFSGSTKPTSTVVADMVNAAGADLTGRLTAAGVSAAGLTSSTAAYYYWCADYVRLATAIRVMEAMAGAGAVPEFWRNELNLKRYDLSTNGAAALGDATAPSDGGGAGPRSHVTAHSLDTGDEADISDAVPRFRRSDQL
jgi:hypothetical protein